MLRQHLKKFHTSLKIGAELLQYFSPRSMHLFAVISNGVYMRGTQRLKYLSKFRDWHIDNRFSNEDAMTLVNSDGLVILGLRGTDIGNVTGNRTRDLIEDIGIAFNKPEFISRLHSDERILRDVIKAYGRNVILTGHSLGGYIGSRLAIKYRLWGKFFNIGSSPSDLESMSSKKIIHYTTNNIREKLIDPLSITSVLRDNFRVIIIKPKINDLHALTNFL